MEVVSKVLKNGNYSCCVYITGEKRYILNVFENKFKLSYIKEGKIQKGKITTKEEIDELTEAIEKENIGVVAEYLYKMFENLRYKEKNKMID